VLMHDLIIIGMSMDMFERLANKIKTWWKNLITRLKAYIKRLIFPIYLFPIKLATYSLFYLVKFVIKLILTILGLILDLIIYPFRSLKNFLKAIFFIILAGYLALTFVVIGDYLTKQYGYIGKFFCSVNMTEKMRKNTVRIVGGFSEGSGFFISENRVLTNFHVIADEPSPKVILSSGKFITPEKILGSKDADLAVIYVSQKHPELVMPLPSETTFYEDEVLVASGYPMGTDIKGNATVLRGRFVDLRVSKKYTVPYIQTDINLVTGMSGGPLADQCGNIKGINTLGLSGLSFFIEARTANDILATMTDANIAKIQVDPSKSPEEAVRAFYVYLKARRMEEGFKLLSRTYLEKTNFEEWTGRFKDILDVDVISSKKYEKTKDTAFVKFSTKNWVDGEAEMHYYEGTWKTIREDGIYKMLKSNIQEVYNPAWDWFYE